MSAAMQLIARLQSLQTVLKQQEDALIAHDLQAINESVTEAAMLVDEVEAVVGDLPADPAELEPDLKSQMQTLSEQVNEARQRTSLLLAQGLAFTRFSLHVLTGSPEVGYDDSGRGKAHAEHWAPARLNVEG